MTATAIDLARTWYREAADQRQFGRLGAAIHNVASQRRAIEAPAAKLGI
jgi:hypothetical protein